MTDFLEDPRLERAEAAWFQAEQEERRGELHRARLHYDEASQLYAEVALSIPFEPDLQEVRGMWALGAISMAARAGMFDRASELAERFLADTDAFVARDRDLIAARLGTYRSLRRDAPPQAPRARDPLVVWRAEIRKAA